MLVHNDQTEIKQQNKNASKDWKNPRKEKKIKTLTNEEAKQEIVVDSVPSIT